MIKIRFAQQRDNSSCGLIALANARKWLGVPTNSRAFNAKMRKVLGTYGKSVGVHHYQIYWLIAKDKHLCNSWYTTLIHPTIGQIDKLLSHGMSAILAVEWPHVNYGHYTLVIKKTGSTYYCANYCNGPTSRVPREYMKKLLRFKRIEGSKAFVFNIRNK